MLRAIVARNKATHLGWASPHLLLDALGPRPG